MLHRVLKPFPFAGNGYTLEHVTVGDEREFGTATDGLVAEGYISLVAKVEESAVEPIEIAEEPAAVIAEELAEPAAELTFEPPPAPAATRRKRK
ncbi:MAG: hypothetical protein E5Y73_17415 [Mesorhizobium sp.]|uniref:hypothetical protein n=1 Tax=Mesorhizobium sp. TaxID=1871066 RepID=UPI0011FF9DA9|nr:hypothetical protein [Mesorhizobium sp.]TIL91456.1 MAG: hypothetical protein E5Y73_17415 [Mesorhizobium sp.]